MSIEVSRKCMCSCYICLATLLSDFGWCQKVPAAQKFDSFRSDNIQQLAFALWREKQQQQQQKQNKNELNELMGWQVQVTLFYLIPIEFSNVKQYTIATLCRFLRFWFSVFENRRNKIQKIILFWEKNFLGLPSSGDGFGGGGGLVDRTVY